MVSRCHFLCHALPLVALWRGPTALSAIPSLSEMVQRCSSAPVALEFNKRNRRAFADVALDPNYDEFDEEEMLGPHWFFPSEISAPGRDLIVAMLNPNPHDRLTIEMVLHHPWLATLNNGGLKERTESIPRMSGLCISGA